MQQESCKMATVGDSPAKYAGQPWTVWAENVPLKDDVGCEEKKKSGDSKRDGNDCMKLRKEDMPLYGLCPTKDELYLVVCDTCHNVIKPQAFTRHCEIRHGEKYPKNCMRICPSSKFRSKASVKQLPSSILSAVSPPYNSKVNASQSKEKNHAMPVVKVERMPEKLPVKKPSSNNNSSSNNSNNNNNSNNSNPTNTNQGSAKASITNGTLKDAGPSASPITAQAVASTATTTPSSEGPVPNSMPGTMAFPNCCNKIACHKPQKKEKLLPCKDREFDANKHCGVKVTHDGKPCTRSLTCKTHALSLRRAVAGRRKPFDELLKDHRAAKEAIQKEKVHAQNMAAAQRVAAQTAATTALAAHAQSGSCSANNSSSSTTNSSNATPSTNTTTTTSSGTGSGLNASSGAASSATGGTQGLISSRGGGGSTTASTGHGAGAGGGGGGGAGGGGGGGGGSLGSSSGGGSGSGGGAITSQTSTKHSAAETTNGKDAAALQHGGSSSNRWSSSGIKATKNTKPNLLPDSHHLHPSTAGHAKEENLSSSTPECCTRLSSEEEGDETHSSKSGSIYLSHHPRPAAMCTFGGRFLKNGICSFNRKSDLVQSCLYNVLERLTHPPPHKKLCVESNLPKEPQLVTNSKDPYEFNMVDTTSGSSHISNSVINSTNKGAVKPKSKSSASKSSKPKDSGTKSPGLLSSAAGSNVAKRKRSSSLVQQVGHTLAATSNPSCGNLANNVMNMLYGHSNALAFTYPNVNLSSTTLNHFNATLPTGKQPSLYKDPGGFVVTGFDNRNFLVNGQYVNNACMPDTVMAQLPTQEERCSGGSGGGSGSVKRSHNGSVKSSCAGSKSSGVLDSSSSSSSSSQSVSSNSLFASVPRNTTMYMDAGSVLASVTLGATSNSTVVSLSNSAQSPTQPSPSATPSPHHRSRSVSPQVTVSSPLPNGIVPSPSEKGSSNHRHTVQGSVQRAHKSGALPSSQAINVHSNSKARHSSSLSSSSANTAAKLQHQSSGSAAGAGSGGSSGDGGGGRGSSSSSPKLSSTTASASAASLTGAATVGSGKGGHQHHHQTLAHMHIKSGADSAATSRGGSNAITKTLGGRLNVPSLQVTFPLPRQMMATGSQPQTVFAMRPTDDRKRQDLTSAVQPQGHGGSSSSMIS